MKLKMCNCRYCKRGRKSSFNQKMIKAAKHSCRSKTRRMLKNGEFDNIPETVRIVYTG